MRREVLESLNQLVREWIKSIALGRRMHWHNIDNIGGRIVTYGSYMLGISHQVKNSLKLSLDKLSASIIFCLFVLLIKFILLIFLCYLC
jgi:poly(A) polymerase Pap1